MPATPAPIRKHLWGWDAPVLQKAVGFLTQSWRPEAGALDLADTLILVPTMESGRRLKEALARATDQHARGASVPWVWTPEQALLPALARGGWGDASRLQSQMAWQQALREVPLEPLEALFPTLPEDCGWLWQVEMAGLLAELKSLLGAGGLTFAAAADLLPHDAPRWRALEMIEKGYLAALAQAGLRDLQQGKRAVAAQPMLPEGVHRVLILAAPDLPPLLLQWAHGCAARGVGITVAVQAPAELAHTFDEIGRPLPAFWGEDADVVVPLPQEAVHLCHDVPAQAARTTALLRKLAPGGRVAVGIGDPEVGAVLKEKLALEGVRVFEPGGVPPQSVGLWHVLLLVRTLLAGGSWRAFAALLRVPEIRIALTGAEDDALEVLEAADDLAAERMPVTLDHALELVRSPLQDPEDARAHPPKPRQQEASMKLETALSEMAKLLSEMQKLPLPEAARALLIHFYGERVFTPNNSVDELVTSLADAWLRCCAEIHEEARRFGHTPAIGEALALSLEILGQTPLTEPRGEVDLVLQGWLELLWEPAPNLVVAGINEEHVPGIIIAHPFLPDKARQQLGLPCQATRFARDAYILRTLAEQRVLQKGALHTLCGRWSERGDSLRPSRLLFLCPDTELPRRVAHLFPREDAEESAPAAATSEPVRTIAWKLRAQVKPPEMRTITPSRIRSYLACPFRDYLSSELHMEATDPGKRELAANEFGTLAHLAFARLAQDKDMRSSADEKQIAEFLVETARQELARLYGRRPAPLVTIQFESLRQHLTHAAQTEAAERQAGWQIYQAEWMFGADDDSSPLLIEGARLRCKVDRVDRHEKSGHLRVLDFKTSDKARDPIEAHVLKVTGRRRIAEEDGWKCFDAGGGRWQWLDLQLPLYAAALRQRGLMPQEAGYFALPKSVQETRVLTWKDFSEEWVDQALETAAEVVRRLRGGVFWPPAAKAYERSYDELFLGDIANTVELVPAP